MKPYFETEPLAGVTLAWRKKRQEVMPKPGEGWFGKVAFANADGQPVRGGGNLLAHG